MFTFSNTPNISNVARLLLFATELPDQVSLLQILQIWSGLARLFAENANHSLNYFRFVAKIAILFCQKLLTNEAEWCIFTSQNKRTTPKT